LKIERLYRVLLKNRAELEEVSLHFLEDLIDAINRTNASAQNVIIVSSKSIPNKPCIDVDRKFTGYKRGVPFCVYQQSVPAEYYGPSELHDAPQ